MFKKLRMSLVLCIVLVLVVCTSVFAAADTVTVTAMTGAFTDAKDTGLAAVAAIAAIAIMMFAAPFAWRYGKKIFKTVSS